MADRTPTELEYFVRQRAPEIAREIGAAARRARNEADLVAEVEKVLGLTDAELKEIQESLAELG